MRWQGVPSNEWTARWVLPGSSEAGTSYTARGKSLLGRIARTRHKRGLIAEGAPDNAALWERIGHLDEDTAHHLSRRIVDFAQANGASLLVFEHLCSFRPERGKYSRRAHAKRTSWLRGKIFASSRYKAWNVGIVTCRIHPKDTSRRCARCGAEVARYAAGEPREGYRPGAPLVWCPVCLMAVNAGGGLAALCLRGALRLPRAA